MLITRLYRARSADPLILGLSSQKMKGLRKLKLEKRRFTEKSTEGGGWGNVNFEFLLSAYS